MNFEETKQKIEEDVKAVTEFTSLNVFKSKYLGKNGIITAMFQELRTMDNAEEKKEFGRQINLLKQMVEEKYEQKENELLLRKKNAGLKNIDMTLPPYNIVRGKTHPITKIMNEINSIFLRMGFSIEEGPEIETEYNNFKALNFPEDHPARDMHDTFYIDDEHLLRTHTSPIQIRTMLKYKPPLKIIAPGRVFRRDAIDASHSPVFHQVEGFMVDENVRFSDLKGVLDLFTKEIFGNDLKTRFRPSFFPFTEPSAEVDVLCVNCKGKGCSVCKQTGWLEILGAGMIHVNVFKAVNYDPEKYTGFAFGMGVERIAMLKYGIDDMRLFYENDIRFLRQF
ncbi:MAG: phenylalanine--tRNA ligase subunit alpha [Candidatus Goldbacteria bacterium]|nr:phenylalanine--tRNA ligase subunit alpha [Candidatus Goldiibacteriota bacterium]HPD19004.1 phenylalanine--tRNA ligase subunit alpha [Candidatus Goldiibacteriota bacterium]